MKRVAIFIDGSNLYHSLKHLFGHAKLDFCKFVAKLSSGRSAGPIHKPRDLPKAASLFQPASRASLLRG